MNSGADEPSSGLNGRLRPRKSNVPSPLSTKSPRRSETRTGQDKVKRTSTPSKTSPNKPDDLTSKSDTTFLCPYCDRKFASKQALTKHVRRIHESSSNQDSSIACLFCNHHEAEANSIVRHMADSHPQQYFACVNCHTRYSSSDKLGDHKNKACDSKLPYRSKLRQKVASASSKEHQNVLNMGGKDDYGKSSNVFSDFNGIVISCEPSQVRDGADIEDNITTNLILPPSKNLGSNTAVEKNAVIVLDDIHWNKRIPPNFSFHNTDADQILSRLGVVHRSPRTGESSKRDWKSIDDSTQKFEKCFDTSFYSKVASNVHENLSKFLDGSFNFNPDPDSMIKTRKSKNSVQINTAEGFPILLATEQYSRNAFDRYMPRAIAPKHKWKWDNLENDKPPINPDQIKRDSHTNNCIITLVSSLDIWTQLRMRKKFEEKFGCPPLEKKTEKQTIISNELKDILESRELPATSSKASVTKVTNQPRSSTAIAEFPASLGLGPSTSRAAPPAAVLSGEWVRPRCYVCCACGARSPDSRLASTHASTHHPNAQVQHYEIVGEQLLNADILKHLYVPPGQMCNRTRPLRGIRECTKCSKSITLEDLHQHMLDCAGDTPAVRRKCRYRPFGVRRRRPRLPDNTIRKKIRKDIRTRQTRTKKSLLRPRPIRTEVGDAETIRKMIADLPAKRHRAPINPNNQSLRPRIKQRSNILIKRRSSEDYIKRKRRNNKDVVISDPESPMNDGTSTKSDEDKPLKPKVKKLASKTVQRTDAEKRNVMGLKRPKRKRLQGKEIEKKDSSNININDSNCTLEGAKNEELTLENSQKRIDIHNVEFKSREHVGRGSSSNRDGQRPGCSGQNNNSRNQCAPVQNVPLKHSIARLTADSEKHDKSVQFHHLFLVQQECNNVNQHVPSGPQLLFENEAAVLTLDKPPLHPYSKTNQELQKSKLNKPRKGLNACIAMLKNKLVDPAPSGGMIPTGHVSVQCGDDEPLYVKPDIPTQAPPESIRNETIVQQEKVLENKLNKKAAPPARPRRTANQDKKGFSGNAEADTMPSKPSTSSCNVLKQISQSSGQTKSTQRESGRSKSFVSEPKVIEITKQPDLIPQKDSATLNPIPSVKTVPVSEIPTTHDGSSHNETHSHNTKPLQLIQETDAPRRNEQVKSNEREQSIHYMPLSQPYELITQETRTHDDVTANGQTSRDTNDAAYPGHSNANYAASFTNQQPVDFHLESESINTVAENYPVPDYNVQVNIPPAHASTNIESMVAIPLDLSGKMLSIDNTQDLSNRGNDHLLRNSYEHYETLDLSNKSQDLGYRTDADNLTINDEIVDLSVKSCSTRSVDMQEAAKDDANDLSLDEVDIDVPTDLTVKKKNTSFPAHLPSTNTQSIDNTLLYKESVKISKLIENEKTFKSPTNHHIKEKLDLSSPNLISGKDKSEVSIKEQNPMPQQKSKNVVSTRANKPDETGDKISNNSLKENTPNVPTVNFKDASVTISPVSKPRKTREDKTNEFISMDSRLTDKASMQVQKPIYDPTLKIPQYRIRATATTEAAGISDSAPNASNSVIHVMPPSTDALPPNNTEVAVIPPQNAFTKAGIPNDSQERTCSYGSVVPLNVTNSSTGNIPNITNCCIPAHLSEFPSTTPIYTSACISVTKIESANSNTLKNVLLTPEITIANTTPVYTLAETSMRVGTKYSHLVPTSPSLSRVVYDAAGLTSSKEESNIASTSSGKRVERKEINISKNDPHVTNPLLNAEHDPETARKIALLPKELVDILGNMPVDHRNQLLNVLPQYVATPTSVTSLQSDLANYSESSQRITSLQNLDNKEIPVPSTRKSLKELELKKLPPLGISQDGHEHMRSLKNIVNFENTPTASALPLQSNLTLHTPISENLKNEEALVHQLQGNKEEHQTEIVKINSDPRKSPRESIPILISNRPSLSHNTTTNKVIDLTEDEIISRTESYREPPLEVPPQLPLPVQPKRNKASNDQTASLRAVRIKAPAERKKSIDNQLLKQTSPVLPSKTNVEPDNEVKKFLHVNVSLNTDISLAIQQAEISSTQQSNKNVTAECKFPAISPNVQESNQSNNCTSRRNSTVDVTKEVVEKVDDIKDIPAKPAAKTTLVTSSILNNTPECVAASGKNNNTLNSELTSSECLSNLVLSSKPKDYQKDNNDCKTETNLLNLDVSKGIDTQFQSVKQDTKAALKAHKDHTISHNISSICEEDSDDDLSLAVICQQKQQHLLRKDLVADDSAKKKEPSSIKRKAKKSKKKLENMDSGCNLLTEKMCNNNTVSTVTVDKNSNSKDDDLLMEDSTNCAVIDKESKLLTSGYNTKKKTLSHNKVLVNMAASNADNISSDASGSQVNDSIIQTKQIDTKERCEFFFVDREKSDKAMDKEKEVEARQKPQNYIHSDLINNAQTQPEDNILERPSTISIRQRSKKKKSSLVDSLYLERKEEQKASELGTEINELDVKEVDATMIDFQKTTSTQSGSIARPQENVLRESLPSNIDTVDFKIQESDCKTIPLRRSRRGKSIGDSVDDENAMQHTEILPENRTPLTKKQLIFSKLLLDEENNIKRPEGVSGSENKKTIVDEVVQTKNICSEISEVTKNVPTKRKNSPSLKRKCKRKKSLNDECGSGEGKQVSLDKSDPSQTESRVDHVHPKLSKETMNQDVCVSSELDSKHTENSTKTDKNITIPLEKRKSGEADTEQTPVVQSKKSKPSEVKNCPDLETLSTIAEVNKITKSNDSLNQSIASNKESHELSIVLPKMSSDTMETIDTIDVPYNKEYKVRDIDSRNKTCYNIPIAGRRTRSKSAVIKSTVYDPYDIDMDDMIESTEPLRQRKISSDQRLSNNTKHAKSSKKTTDSELMPRSDVEQKKQNTESYSKNNISDSDDSSKSDIPLKKYVEEKEKKISKLDESVVALKNDTGNDSETYVDTSAKQERLLKKDKRTLSNSGNAGNQDETEEQLRSEQFMESFGFFSERKPRKSNLLATKKISETFHIIANESDDMYFGFKEKSSKKSMHNERRISTEAEISLKTIRQRSPSGKKLNKRGRKKKTSTVTAPSYCHICKMEFHRPDNYLRHQMSLQHVSKLSEVEMKIKTIPIQEEPNYLLAYKEHLNRMKAITDKMTKRKKNSKSAPKIIPLSLEEILADVNKIVREQQLSQRGLSCDEELFLDCCELLKESHKKKDHITEIPSASQEIDNRISSPQPANVGLDFLGKCDVDTKCDDKNDGDVDSITAKTILESEEVRNLENDLISGLKQAASNASNLNSNIVFQPVDDATNQQEQYQNFGDRLRYNPEPLNSYEEPEDHSEGKTKKYPEFKEKMYPDIEEFDMFEDKFDKIKRKCRSQAAAAKQTPLVVEPSTSRKGRKKSEKKKGKKGSRKNHPSAVLTKGALKGFDGIKVSIPTSDINISALVSPLESSHRKRKKSSSKKRRENKNSESSSKYDSDHHTHERSASSKNVDVYEFMDNEDMELFEFRPSTLMERFKSISNKEGPSTSKVNPVADEAEESSVSGSDGDDFVYMSDDYVCSDDETENSLASCDVTNVKIVSDIKKLATQIKRRDAIEKNAVMGKIFKNNAMRSERKPPKIKEPVKPKANLDQLFDSLLEDEPSSSLLNDETSSLKDEVSYGRKFLSSSPIQPELPAEDNYSSAEQKRPSTDNDNEVSSLTANSGPPTCKITMKSLMGEHRSMKHRKRHSLSPREFKSVSPIKHDLVSSRLLQSSSKDVDKKSSQDNFSGHQASTTSKVETTAKIKESKTYAERSPVSKEDGDIGGQSEYNESYDQSTVADETGVARQRARRKCTVGKQNVLAESWSSESEPDGGPPRPHSAESVVSAAPRKKKGKKKDGHHAGGKRNNSRHISIKKQDTDSRVTSSNRNTTTHASGSGRSASVETNKSVGRSEAAFAEPGPSGVFAQPAAPQPSTSAGAGAGEPDAGRCRTLFGFWAAEGAAHDQQVRPQHGWIVGDSHKKLVTMLAQAKRRKRNNDDKRHLVE